ncbi:MAG: phosphatase PAP2 family protein [Rhizobiaceae bacterium]
MRIFPGRAPYGALLAFLAVDVAWLLAAGTSVDMGSAAPSLAATAALACAAFALRIASAGPGRGIVVRDQTVVRPALVDTAIVAAEAYVFLLCSWNVVRVLNHLSMTLALPLADDMLASWDAALGLDWNAYFAFVAARPALADFLGASYTSLTPVSAFALLGLLAFGRVRQAEFFVVTFFATAVVCTAAGAFFPAEAAVAHLLDRPELIASFSIEPGLYHLAHLEALRSGAMPVFDLENLPGLVTFPSFHTAAGVVVAWCYRRTLLFWPVSAYAAMMIAATPVFGGHYFVDLIAGTAVALSVLVFTGSLRRYRGLFAEAAAGRDLPVPA